MNFHWQCWWSDTVTMEMFCNQNTITSEIPIYFESFLLSNFSFRLMRRRKANREKLHESDKNTFFSFSFNARFAIFGARFTARDFPWSAQSSLANWRQQIENILIQFFEEKHKKVVLSNYKMNHSAWVLLAINVADWQKITYWRRSFFKMSSKHW